jgi:hypothetical protein
MEQTQTQSTVVQFTSVDPTTMKFSEEFRCARSTAGQVVVGLRWLANSVASLKEATNDYQKTLYPTISVFANEVCDKYMSTFVSDVTEPLQVQVYGANLNGRLNDGRLKHDIPCKNTDRRSRYKYSQLGQLLSLLYDRLLFISRRDVTKVQRYVDNVEERKHFESLQALCGQFCDYLRGDENSVMSRWTSFVNSSRQTNGVQTKSHETERQPRGRGDGQSRGRSEWQPRGRGDGQSRGRSEWQPRGRGDGQTRGRGDGQTRGRGDGQTRGRGQ